MSKWSTKLPNNNLQLAENFLATAQKIFLIENSKCSILRQQCNSTRLSWSTRAMLPSRIRPLGRCLILFFGKPFNWHLDNKGYVMCKLALILCFCWIIHSVYIALQHWWSESVKFLLSARLGRWKALGAIPQTSLVSSSSPLLQVCWKLKVNTMLITKKSLEAMGNITVKMSN